MPPQSVSCACAFDVEHYGVPNVPFVVAITAASMARTAMKTVLDTTTRFCIFKAVWDDEAPLSAAGRGHTFHYVLRPFSRTTLIVNLMNTLT